MSNHRAQSEGLVIIFGWGGGRPKDLGPALPITCPNCNNQTVYHYFTTSKWFSLFFIPLIPYERRHLLICPVCTKGRVLSRDQASHAKALTEAYGAWRSQSLSDEGFYSSVNDFYALLTPADGGGTRALATDATSEVPPQLNRFASANDGLSRARAWNDEGFTASEAMDWDEVVGFDPVAARAWRDAGFSPSEAAAWLDIAMNPEEAKAWREAGFTPTQAAEWRSQPGDHS